MAFTKVKYFIGKCKFFMKQVSNVCHHAFIHVLRVARSPTVIIIDCKYLQRNCWNITRWHESPSPHRTQGSCPSSSYVTGDISQEIIYLFVDITATPPGVLIFISPRMKSPNIMIKFIYMQTETHA